MSGSPESDYHPPPRRSQASLLKMHQFSLHEANEQSHKDNVVSGYARRRAKSGASNVARNKNKVREDDQTRVRRSKGPEEKAPRQRENHF